MSDQSDLQARRTPVTAAELQRRAVHGSIWTVVHVLIYLPVAFVANAVVARALGVTDYGHLAFLTAVLSLTLLLGNGGFSLSAIQAGSRAEAADRSSDANHLLRSTLGFHIAFELPVVLLLTLTLARGQSVSSAAIIVAALVLTCAFGAATLGITIANRTAAAAKIAIGVNIVVQSASVVVALSTHSANLVWATRALLTALGLGLSLLLLAPERRRAALSPRLPRGLGVSFWRFAFLSWIASVVGTLVFSRSEIFLLQAYNQAAALGIYALAFGLSQQITAPIDALLLPLLPSVAGVLSEWPERARLTFERSTRVSSVMGGVIAAAIVPPLVFAVPVIYGGEFSSAAWLFVPLALTSIFQSANNPVLAFINARELGRQRVRANVAALAVDIVVAIVAIPLFGAWGAVAAAVSGQLVALLWLLTAEPLARDQGAVGMARLFLPFTIGVAASCVALFGASLLRGSAPDLVVAALSAILGAAGFLLALRVMKSGLHPSDARVLGAGLPPRLGTSLDIALAFLTSRS